MDRLQKFAVIIACVVIVIVAYGVRDVRELPVASIRSDKTTAERFSESDWEQFVFGETGETTWNVSVSALRALRITFLSCRIYQYCEAELELDEEIAWHNLPEEVRRSVNELLFGKLPEGLVGRTGSIKFHRVNGDRRVTIKCGRLEHGILETFVKQQDPLDR